MELLEKLFPTILINIHGKKVENSFFQNTLSEKCRYSEFFWSVFPAFGLNMNRYSVSLRIQSEFRKMGTRKSPNMDIFHAVTV